MPRNRNDEAGAEAIVAKLEESWKEFGQAVKVRGGRTVDLLRLVNARGYRISESRLRDQINDISRGAGVIQNPVLLAIICEIIEYDVAIAFGARTDRARGQQQDLASPQVRARDLAAFVVNEMEARKRRVKASSDGVRRDWPWKLNGIAWQCTELTKGIWAWPWTPTENLKEMAQKCIRPFPGRRLFEVLRFEKVLAVYVNRKVSMSNTPRQYLYVCLSLASAGLIQTFRAFGELSTKKPRKGEEFRLSYESADVQQEFAPTLVRFAGQLVLTNEVVAEQANQPDLEFDWWLLAHLNWQILSLWAAFLGSKVSLYRPRDTNSAGDMKDFISQFLRADGDVFKMGIASHHVMVNKLILVALENVEDHLCALAGVYKHDQHPPISVTQELKRLLLRG